MEILEVTLSAATKEESQELVDLIAVAATELEADLSEYKSAVRSRKKAIEIGSAVTFLLQSAAAIGTGLVANIIYEKIKTVSRQSGSQLVKRSTETEVEIINEKTGARIIVKKRKVEEISS